MGVRDFVLGGYAGLRSIPFERTTHYDEAADTYVNSAVCWGFPVGGIGSGGIGVGTAGGFEQLRINNNWMCPIPTVRGSFFALRWPGGARILRQQFHGGSELENIRPVARTRFTGELPHFRLRFEDEWPFEVELSGFSPLIPHDLRASTLPAARFELRVRNTSDRAQTVHALFSWENVLGRGGTGMTGVSVRAGIPVHAYGRLRYDDVAGNRQREVRVDGLHGLSFETDREVDPESHRQSTIGRYLLLADGAGVSTSVGSWDAADDRPSLIDRFVESGELMEERREARALAGAVAAARPITAGESHTFPFVLVWWLPDHVVEKQVTTRARSRRHAGVRAGHYYENHFASPEAVARHLHGERDSLGARSRELTEFLAETDLPPWLQRMLVSSADSVLCNSVLPKGGALHTLEGCGWNWYFGGLTGTMDQRLSSHLYTATFFTELDKSEVDLFRRLAKNGEVPHGNGNCDLALGDADVPYGWPLELRGALAERQWPDLTLSTIIQFYRLWATTGDGAWLDRAWPDILAMYEHLRRLCQREVPEGGSTFDTFRFPGTFIYTAGLWATALSALAEMAATRAPQREQEMRDHHERVRGRIDDALWNEAGGYYRPVPDRDVLFLCAMAGDWTAHYTGLSSPFDGARVRSHLQHLHRAFIAGRNPMGGRAAFPYFLARPAGRPIKNRILLALHALGYVSQVLTYFAAPAIYAGLVREGLDAARLIHDRNTRGGWPWCSDLYGNGGFVYMTHPAVWAIPLALSGATLDSSRSRLALAPQSLGPSAHQRLPVCFPRFWAVLEHEPRGDEMVFEVRKHFGEPQRIQMLQTPEGVRPVNWEMRAGARYELRL